VAGEDLSTEEEDKEQEKQDSSKSRKKMKARASDDNSDPCNDIIEEAIVEVKERVAKSPEKKKARTSDNKTTLVGNLPPGHFSAARAKTTHEGRAKQHTNHETTNLELGIQICWCDGR
jgi:hypothetical protein